MPTASKVNSATARLDAWTIFLVFLRLGLTSFGGPIVHLGYFREEFVRRRGWLDERSYADLVALCQFLPGPASSQVGLAIGLLRGGYRGSLAAWAGFTLPSAVALTLFALGISTWGDALPSGILQGLKIVAVAVVAQAVWGMARTLCTDGPRIAITLMAASAVLLLPFVWSQVAVIVAAGLIGLLVFRPTAIDSHATLPVTVTARSALVALVLFFKLLGPLFTFAAFLGASMNDAPSSLFGAALCLVAVFVPSFLLVIGALPFWERLRSNRRTQAALAGINAAVVGLLLAALYDPVWTSAIKAPEHFVLALVALAALMYWKLPPWLVVLGGAIGGGLLGLMG